MAKPVFAHSEQDGPLPYKVTVEARNAILDILDMPLRRFHDQLKEVRAEGSRADNTKSVSSSLAMALCGIAT